MYVASCSYADVQEDSFENGCVGPSWNVTEHIGVSGDSISDVLINLAARFSTKTENIGFDPDGDVTRVTVSIHEHFGGRAATEEDKEKWREGNRRLYLADYVFTIKKTENVNLSENIETLKTIGVSIV